MGLVCHVTSVAWCCRSERRPWKQPWRTRLGERRWFLFSCMPTTAQGLFFTLILSLEVELEKIEQQIFDLEGAYLQDTAAYGNILRGWGALDLEMYVQLKEAFVGLLS